MQRDPLPFIGMQRGYRIMPAFERRRIPCGKRRQTFICSRAADRSSLLNVQHPRKGEGRTGVCCKGVCCKQHLSCLLWDGTSVFPSVSRSVCLRVGGCRAEVALQEKQDALERSERQRERERLSEPHRALGTSDQEHLPTKPDILAPQVLCEQGSDEREEGADRGAGCKRDIPTVSELVKRIPSYVTYILS